MSTQIDNPYVASYVKFGTAPGHCVLYRYLIQDKIKFSHVATTKDSKMAKKLARLLNKDWRENNGVEQEELSHEG
jgi:hypothetical protein